MRYISLLIGAICLFAFAGKLGLDFPAKISLVLATTHFMLYLGEKE
jgi:hypothetical protein